MCIGYFRKISLYATAVLMTLSFSAFAHEDDASKGDQSATANSGNSRGAGPEDKDQTINGGKRHERAPKAEPKKGKLDQDGMKGHEHDRDSQTR